MVGKSVGELSNSLKNKNADVSDVSNDDDAEDDNDAGGDNLSSDNDDVGDDNNAGGDNSGSDNDAGDNTSNIDNFDFKSNKGKNSGKKRSRHFKKICI